MRDAGRKIDLDPLDHVSTSVAMHEYTDYDLVAGRWIDTWKPQKHPENTRVQSFRCYTPADLCLLFKGLDLEIIDVFFDEKRVDTRSTDETACYDTAFRDTYAYRIACRKKR
jgi:hypothetical protein